MNLLQDIQNYFKGTESKIKRINDINSQLKEISLKRDVLVSNYNTITKGGFEDDMGFDIFDFQKSLGEMRRKEKSLQRELGVLNNDKGVAGVLSGLKATEAKNIVKSLYKEGKITLEDYNKTPLSVKTEKGQVKYADVVVVTEENEILLLMRSLFDSSNPGAWVVPGGHVDEGETDEQAAKRELLEEAGLSVDNLAEDISKRTRFYSLGVYEDSKVHIAYYCLTIAKKEDVELLLQAEETRDYLWVPNTDLINYEMVFNMRDNILNMMNWELTPQQKIIRKAFEQGVIDEEVFNKAMGHKYIRKTPDGKGGWNYVYKEEIVSHKWGDDDVVSPSKIFPNPVKQKTKDDITTYFIKRFGVKHSHQVPLDKRKKLWNDINYYQFTGEPEIRGVDVKDIVPSQDFVNMTALKGELEEGIPLGISVPDSDKIVLFNGHHRVAKKIIDGEDNVDIKIIPSTGLFKHLQNKDIKKSVYIDSEYSLIQKAINLGLLSDDDIEKAWKKHPVGSVVTRKDGKKYRKISETNDSKKDWVEVKDGKAPKTEDLKKNKQGKPDIGESAKGSSETALQNAIKRSPDEEVRRAAHEELKRREKEEKPEEETEDKKGKVKPIEEENKYVEKFRTLSDDQIKFYLDAPYPEVKEAAKFIADERGLKLISKEDYIKEFEDYSDSYEAGIKNKLSDRYGADSKEIDEYLSKNGDIDSSVGQYVGSLFGAVRLYNSDKEEYNDIREKSQVFKNNINTSIENLDKVNKNLSKLIGDNKINKNTVLYRTVNTVRKSSFFENLEEGEIYEDKSFSSTSLRKLDFGTFELRILAKKGSNVACLGNMDEHEYLIDKGSKFRVIEKNKDGKGITVELL